MIARAVRRTTLNGGLHLKVGNLRIGFLHGRLKRTLSSMFTIKGSPANYGGSWSTEIGWVTFGQQQHVIKHEGDCLNIQTNPSGLIDYGLSVIPVDNFVLDLSDYNCETEDSEDSEGPSKTVPLEVLKRERRLLQGELLQESRDAIMAKHAFLLFTSYPRSRAPKLMVIYYGSLKVIQGVSF
ncbi:hypothetical protein C5167_020302 [Papaver somniferum]|uniref:Uncharacterized protein n=1 Tax=Papaver somniferum TaxID=3469 RepID=A0A4Y7IVR4_PAPSO|nr:hypothetical protein C5167_020302 [Papaver somniferum]